MKPSIARNIDALPWLAVIIAAAALLIHLLRTPLTGDDLFYATLPISRPEDGLLNFMSAIWHNCNARFGDLTNHLWLCLLPRPATALLCALLFAAMFVALHGLSGLSSRNPGAWSICLAAIFTVCPWWDEFHLFVVQFNYTWAIALSATSLWLICSRKMNKARWLYFLPIAFISGFGHEIVGLPMAAGITAWLIFSRHDQVSVYKKWIIGSLLAGCLVSMSSPASYARLMAPSNDYLEHIPAWRLILTSGYMALILAADILYLLLFRRQFLSALCRTTWLPLAVITLASLAFVIAGNVPGRSGWAVQFFGVAAIARQWAESAASRQRHLSTGMLITCLLTALMCAQWSGVIYWQWKIDDETARCVRRYHACPSAPIEIECLDDGDIPIWLMGKVRGVPFCRDRWAGDAFEKPFGYPLTLAGTPH